MDSERRNAQRPDVSLDAWVETVRKESDKAINPENEVRMRQALSAFRHDLEEHPHIKKLARRKLRREWIWSRWSRATRWTLALGSGMATAGVIVVLLLVASGTALGTTWEEVVRRFQAVTSFSVKVYTKSDLRQKPEERELWMGKDGRLRMHLGSLVVFGRDGKATKAYDMCLRKETTADSRSIQLLEKFTRNSEFSLNVVLNSISGGRSFESTPKISVGEKDTEDFDVFEVDAPNGGESARIWTTAESKLPVRMLFTDTVEGASVEAFFTYTMDHTEDFFDPAAFEKHLYGSPVGADPQGRLQDERTAINDVPVVKSAGINSDGAIWIVASSSLLGKSGSDNSYGFVAMSDDLGRTYSRIATTYQTKKDRSLDVFVPDGYPFDTVLPKTVTATAVDAEKRVLGNRQITDLRRNVHWPADMQVTEPIVIKGQQMLAIADWGQLDRLLALIPGEPETHDLALEREKLRLASLAAKGEYAVAISLGERLMPLLEKQYQATTSPASLPSLFNDYVFALACDGKADRAQAVIDRVRELVDAVPSTMSERQKSGVLRERQHVFRASLIELASRLSGQGMLSPEIISEIMRVNVRRESPFKDMPEFR